MGDSSDSYKSIQLARIRIEDLYDKAREIQNIFRSFQDALKDIHEELDSFNSDILSALWDISDEEERLKGGD